jgi:hypothetical protein
VVEKIVLNDNHYEIYGKSAEKQFFFNLSYKLVNNEFNFEITVKIVYNEHSPDPKIVTVVDRLFGGHLYNKSS